MMEFTDLVFAVTLKWLNESKTVYTCAEGNELFGYAIRARMDANVGLRVGVDAVRWGVEYGIKPRLFYTPGVNIAVISKSDLLVDEIVITFPPGTGKEFVRMFKQQCLCAGIKL